jgi:hypothetical protein
VAGLEKVVMGVGGSLVCWRNTDRRDVSSGFDPLDGYSLSSIIEYLRLRLVPLLMRCCTLV